MSDWNEWWLDIHSDSCKANVQNVMEGRIKAAKSKGCDGVDPDNVDSVSPVLLGLVVIRCTSDWSSSRPAMG